MKKIFKPGIKFFLASLILGVAITLFYFIARPTEETKPWHIAMVGPISGNSAKNGRSMMQGVQLYLDLINSQGGVDGRRVELSVFDDRNDPIRAGEIANELVAQKKYLAVIGHNFSTPSIQAGEIYKQNGIPAITPTATNVQLTENNKWFFRATFNDRSQSRFLANISHKILNQNRVSIIQEKQTYGSYLAEVFKITSLEQGVTIANDYHFDGNSPHLDRYLKAIVTSLKAHKENAGTIFLASHGFSGAKLLKLIKDAGLTNPIITPDVFAGRILQETFDKEPIEKIRPGFYTEGIYVSTPLIYDTANEKAQLFREDYVGVYEEEPDWRAAFSYDCAMMIVEAIRQVRLINNDESLKENQKRIRNFLSNLDRVEKAIPGVTGFNYFDRKGDSQKPISLGVYRSGSIVSALTQIQDIRDFSAISNLEQALEKGDIIKMDDKYLYKTNVVYTGIQVKKISELDLKSLESTIEFVLWFRYRQDSNIYPDDIEFLNALDGVSMTPIEDKNIDRDGISYRPFLVRGRFKIDFLNNNYTYRKHDLGIRFRHQHLPHSNLIYVNDELGMGLAHGTTLTEKLKKSQILSRALDWVVDNAWIYQDVVYEDSHGNPDYLKVREGKVEYSRFNFGIQIQKKSFTLRGINHKYIDFTLVISLIFVVFLFPIEKLKVTKSGSKTLFLVHILFISILVLSVEESLLQNLQYLLNSYHLDLIIVGFDILWWILPAMMINRFIEVFLWRAMESSNDRKIPGILRRFVSFVIYLLALFGIIAFVYDQKLTGLLATSGVFAMIIGLAIQMNISNIFSGIAINVERPLRLNDWVRIGADEGRVVDINWRTTRLMQADGSVLSIPNSIVSDSHIHNFNYPDDLHWESCVVHVSPQHPPERVKKILYDAINATEHILKKPAPSVRMQALTEWSADYNISFCIRDFSDRVEAKEAAWQRIWTHLNHAGLNPAVQRQEVHMFEGTKERGKEEARKAQAILNEVDIFEPLSEEERNYLKDRMQMKRFQPKEFIVRQGESRDSLYIIVEGVVSVRVHPLNEEKSIEVARLGAGNFFGEMALMTGEARTADVIAKSEAFLYEILKEDIAPILEKNPDISKPISEILTERKLMTQSQLEKKQMTKDNSLSSQILKKIHGFFNLFSSQ